MSHIYRSSLGGCTWTVFWHDCSGLWLNITQIQVASMIGLVRHTGVITSDRWL